MQLHCAFILTYIKLTEVHTRQLMLLFTCLFQMKESSTTVNNRARGKKSLEEKNFMVVHCISILLYKYLS